MKIITKKELQAITKKEFNTLQFNDNVTKTQALELGDKALKAYTKRSSVAKKLEKYMYDVVLAGGCYHQVIEYVGHLIEKYDEMARITKNIKNGRNDLNH